jgi:hypothetical protein
MQCPCLAAVSTAAPDERNRRLEPAGRGTLELTTTWEGYELARRGEGPTVFDWLVEIVRDHGADGSQAVDGRTPRASMTTPKKEALEATGTCALKPVQTDAEWEAYHSIRERVLWTARGLVGLYDRHHPDEKKTEHHALLLLSGAEPVASYALIFIHLSRGFGA